MGVEKLVTAAKVYLVNLECIEGGGMLMNKPPDMSQAKSMKKTQAKEDLNEKEWKTWREKLYFREDLGVYVPGENLVECLKDGAKYWGAKIPGEGNKTYTDVIKSAVICEDMRLGLGRDDEKSIFPFGRNCNGNPSKGKKSMVFKIRPLIKPWSGAFSMHVFDQRLTSDVLATILTMAGMFRGLGDWRPNYGRFNLAGLREA